MSRGLGDDQAPCGYQAALDACLPRLYLARRAAAPLRPAWPMCPVAVVTMSHLHAVQRIERGRGSETVPAAAQLPSPCRVRGYRYGTGLFHWSGRRSVVLALLLAASLTASGCCVGARSRARATRLRRWSRASRSPSCRAGSAPRRVRRPRPAAPTPRPTALLTSGGSMPALRVRVAALRLAGQAAPAQPPRMAMLARPHRVALARRMPAAQTQPPRRSHLRALTA